MRIGLSGKAKEKAEEEEKRTDEEGGEKKNTLGRVRARNT